MQRYASAPKLLAAALMMAPYQGELEAVQGAYEFYRGDVAQRITRVEDYVSTQDWRSVPSGETTAIQPIIKELGDELYWLREPGDRLLATARQFAVAREVDPASEAAVSALRHLRNTWDQLERMESYNDRLPDLAAILKSYGITFVEEWKHFSSDNGYIGYGLTAPTLGVQEEGERIYFERPYRVEMLRDAAQKINDLHGEERFVFKEYPETKPGEGDYAHETMRRIGIGGNWQERGLRYWELTSAEGTASYTTESLNTLPHMTERLMALQLAG